MQKRTLSPVHALFLSFLGIGAGQLYNGQLLKALLVVVLYASFLSVSMRVLLPSFLGFVVALASALLLSLLVHLDAFSTARRKGIAVRRQFTRWWVYSLFVLALHPSFYTLTRTACSLQAYRIPSHSMSPTLQPGDFFIATDDGCSQGQIARGDIVVFSPPDRTDELYADRVVGLAGETLELRDKVLMVNGEPLEEPYTVQDPHSLIASRDRFGPFVVPPRSVFIMGDNRDVSRDSRYFGPVDHELIRGRLLYVYFAREIGRIGRRLQPEFRNPDGHEESEQ